MTTYRFRASIDSEDTAGMSVYDWFECEAADHILDREYPTPASADEAARAAYRGPDVNGVEVRWDVEPAA